MTACKLSIDQKRLIQQRLPQVVEKAGLKLINVFKQQV